MEDKSDARPIRILIHKHRLEAALLVSETRFRELFNHMTSGVAVYEAADGGTDFVFKDFNPAAESMDRIPREGLIGRSVLEVFPGIREFGLFDVFQRVWRTGIPEHFPVTLYRDARIQGWRENYVAKLPSGEIVAVYDDVTEKKRAEEEMMRSASALVDELIGMVQRISMDLRPGLIGMRERAAALQGSLEIQAGEKEPGSSPGTRVVLRVPAQRQAP